MIMNHISNGFRAIGAEHPPLTRRAQAKLQTREKVLQAAKRLFIDRGYDAATIRDIAQEAGMSTGAVFANFTDKNDLFHAVMAADMDRQLKQLDALGDHAGPVEAVIADLYAIGYRQQIEQLPLLQAAIGLSWSQGLNNELGDRPQFARAVVIVRDQLSKAIARGELKKDADITLLAEMLWDAYGANYRRAVFDGWSLERLTERFAKQTAVILAGAKA
jgi:AcrR family transcriptional regulator